jgi:hypothetical protein
VRLMPPHPSVLGAAALHVAAGEAFTCALVAGAGEEAGEGHAVRCFGSNRHGQLGYGPAMRVCELSFGGNNNASA